MERIITQLIENAYGWVPALIGGVVDYLNQLQRGKKTLSILGIATHLLSAVFFGWMSGTAVGGLEYSPNMVAAAGGMGGYLGVRLADLITYQILQVNRRGKK